jgi:hypothetical protein
MITLYDATDDITIELPDDLHWTDEFDWSPIVQSAEYSIGGSLFLEESEMQGGRFITLGGAHEDMGWVGRDVVLALQERRDILGRKFTLTLKDSRQFVVAFRRSDTPLSATPVKLWDQTQSEDLYKIALKFITV